MMSKGSQGVGCVPAELACVNGIAGVQREQEGRFKMSVDMQY